MNAEPTPESRPSNTPEPQRSRSSRMLIFGAALALGVGSLLGLMRSRPGDPVGEAPSSLGEQSMTPQVRLSRKGALSAPSSSPLSSSYSEAQLVLFVPDDNGDLQKKSFAPKGDIPSDPTAAKEKLAAQAVEALMQATPETFPPGTTLLNGVVIERGVPTLNFSREFADPNFWQGSMRTLAALDSLAKTVAATKNQVSGGEGDAIRITVEGKPIDTLGEVDLRTPYSPSASPDKAESAP